MFPPEKPTDTFPYRIELMIGTGSMGVVYRAWDTSLDRAVAIKTLRESVLAEASSEVQDEMRRRFLQEARAAARLTHPGVTVVHRVDEEDATPYIVMEWLEGQTLEEIVAERGRLPLGEAVGLLVATLETLEAAHCAGVVHRDVKPANLIVLQDGRLKVTDFGIALLKGQELVRTQAGVVLATPQFASPEQLRGGEIDARSDLFSCGVLLFHMLSGAYPFSGGTFLDLANAVLQKAPAPLTEHLAQIPPGLEAVLAKALRKDRKHRYESAAAMAEALRPFLTGTHEAASASGPQPLAVREGGTARRSQTLRDLPGDPALAVARLADGWPSQTLPRQVTSALLERLLEKPLHAAAFAGAVTLGGICLFLEDGVLLGAVDLKTGESGDAVSERLPQEGEAELHPLPDSSPPDLVGLLTSVLHPPRRRQSDLDSSFINLTALAGKLRAERFDGILRFHRGKASALLFYAGGELAVSLYSEGWSEIPVDESWVDWVNRFPVRAHVEEKSTVPVGCWYRYVLRDQELVVQMDFDHDAGDTKGMAGRASGATGPAGDTTGRRVRQLFRAPRTGSKGFHIGIHPAGDTKARLGDVGYERAPAYDFLAWSLRELPPYMAERDLTARWKYLNEWLALVERAVLYHELPRPDSRESDFFDLVTTDAQGKVLHVASRRARPSKEDFYAFLDKVVEAKQARTKTGDLGGAFYIAQHFEDEVLDAYGESLHSGSSGSWRLLEEALTGYEGFVRIGPRRGFHLLLVEETDDGFVPLIPS